MSTGLPEKEDEPPKLDQPSLASGQRNVLSDDRSTGLLPPEHAQQLQHQRPVRRYRYVGDVEHTIAHIFPSRRPPPQPQPPARPTQSFSAPRQRVIDVYRPLAYAPSEMRPTQPSTMNWGFPGTEYPPDYYDHFAQMPFAEQQRLLQQQQQQQQQQQRQQLQLQLQRSQLPQFQPQYQIQYQDQYPPPQVQLPHPSQSFPQYYNPPPPNPWQPQLSRIPSNNCRSRWRSSSSDSPPRQRRSPKKRKAKGDFDEETGQPARKLSAAKKGKENTEPKDETKDATKDDPKDDTKDDTKDPKDTPGATARPDVASEVDPAGASVDPADDKGTQVNAQPSSQPLDTAPPAPARPTYKETPYRILPRGSLPSNAPFGFPSVLQPLTNTQQLGYPVRASQPDVFTSDVGMPIPHPGNAGLVHDVTHRYAGLSMPLPRPALTIAPQFVMSAPQAPSPPSREPTPVFFPPERRQRIRAWLEETLPEKELPQQSIQQPQQLQLQVTKSQPQQQAPQQQLQMVPFQPQRQAPQQQVQLPQYPSQCPIPPQQYQQAQYGPQPMIGQSYYTTPTSSPYGQPPPQTRPIHVYQHRPLPPVPMHANQPQGFPATPMVRRQPNFGMPYTEQVPGRYAPREQVPVGPLMIGPPPLRPAPQVPVQGVSARLVHPSPTRATHRQTQSMDLVMTAARPKPDSPGSDQSSASIVRSAEVSALEDVDPEALGAAMALHTMCSGGRDAEKSSNAVETAEKPDQSKALVVWKARDKKSPEASSSAARLPQRPRPAEPMTPLAGSRGRLSIMHLSEERSTSTPGSIHARLESCTLEESIKIPHPDLRGRVLGESHTQKDSVSIKDTDTVVSSEDDGRRWPGSY